MRPRVLGSILLAVGCAFDASGGGHGGGGETSEGESGERTTGDGSSRGDASAEGTASDSGATTEASNDPLAVLEISEAPLVELGLGLVELDDHADVTVEIVNTGLAGATSVALDPLVPPFSLVDDGCGGAIAAGDACEMTVRFSPSAPVASEQAFVLRYDRGDGSTADAAAMLRGGGMTVNLVRNPIAEEELTGWSEVTGRWSAGCEYLDPLVGTGCFYAGLQTPLSVTESTMVQAVSVDPWAAEIDAGEVAVSVRGWARSHSLDWGDAWRIRFVFRTDTSLISTLVDSGEPQSTFDWTLVEGEGPVPAGTTRVRIQLDCVKPSDNAWCDAYFDDFEVILHPAE